MNPPEFFQIFLLEFQNDRELIARPENMICARFFNIVPLKKNPKKECSTNLKFKFYLNLKGFNS